LDAGGPRRWYFVFATRCVFPGVNSLPEILARFAVYRELQEFHPLCLPGGIDKAGGILLCVLATRILRPVNWKDIPREMGLASSPLPAVVFDLAASAPMLAGLALSHGLTPHLDSLNILFLTVLSPLTEEIAFRGLGTWNLQRGTDWPFWALVWPQAPPLGLGHIGQGQGFVEMAEWMILTGSGAVLFAWLVRRWQSLWYGLALHIRMNLWLEVFSVAKTALGGWFPFAMQIGTGLVGVGITPYCTKNKTAQQSR
jgi:membrane protease YdiL (CAAX protease family)